MKRKVYRYTWDDEAKVFLSPPAEDQISPPLAETANRIHTSLQKAVSLERNFKLWSLLGSAAIIIAGLVAGFILIIKESNIIGSVLLATTPFIGFLWFAWATLNSGSKSQAVDKWATTHAEYLRLELISHQFSVQFYFSESRPFSY